MTIEDVKRKYSVNSSMEARGAVKKAVIAAMNDLAVNNLTETDLAYHIMNTIMIFSSSDAQLAHNEWIWFQEATGLNMPKEKYIKLSENLLLSEENREKMLAALYIVLKLSDNLRDLTALIAYITIGIDNCLSQSEIDFFNTVFK